MIPNSEIARRETLTALVGTYQQAAQDIIQGYALLEQAQERLRGAFLPSINYRFEINPPESSGVGERASGITLARIKRDAWHMYDNSGDVPVLLREGVNDER